MVCECKRQVARVGAVEVASFYWIEFNGKISDRKKPVTAHYNIGGLHVTQAFVSPEAARTFIVTMLSSFDVSFTDPVVAA